MKNFKKNIHRLFIKGIKKMEGITLIEILVAIAVVAILATTVLPGFSKIKKMQILKSTTEDMVSAIGEARSETMASLDSSSYGVNFESNKITIFQGTSFSVDSIHNKVIDITPPATISSINLNNNGTSLYFNRLSGLPNTSGTITISMTGVDSKIVTISATGSASAN
jgi:Tfp pilus assembly protein FimT